MKRTLGFGALVSFAIAATLSASLSGCGSDKTDPTKEAPVPNTRQGGNNGPSASTPAMTQAAQTAAAPAINAAPAAAGPNGRSPVPSVADWNGVTKEVGVKGSSKLNCETKMLREWLRISCRGKNETGGEPKAVRITKGGGRGDTFTFASNGVASLVMPFVDGADLTAEFEWTDGKKELVVSWPHGAPEPLMKGEFR